MKHKETNDKWNVICMFTSFAHHIIAAIGALYTLFIMPPQSQTVMALVVWPTAQNLDYYPLNS